MDRTTISVKDLVNNTIHAAQTCIFSYLSTDGYPTGKALNKPRRMDANGVYWFSTVNHSGKINGSRQYPKASLYFFDPDQFIGVSLNGTVEVIDDPAVKAAFWQDGDELFYPNGINGDDYVILKFTARHGQLYAQIQHFCFSPEILE